MSSGGESWRNALARLFGSSRRGECESHCISSIYEKKEKIGDGSEAAVYRAVRRDDPDGKSFALKVFKASIDPSLIPRYAPKNILQLSMRVKNPHIVDVIDCEIDMSSGQPQVWLVSEFCDKGDLFVRLKQLRNIHMIMPRAVALRWVVQLAIGLCALNNYNIVHRDIKPENIFVTSEFGVKLGDFGLARQMNPGEAGDYGGTEVYMPFEVRMLGEYSTKWDMWSLGCVAYDLGCPTRFIHELEAIDDGSGYRKWFWDQRDALDLEREDLFEELQKMVDRVIEENIENKTPEDQEYIDVVKCLLRVDPQQRPSVYKFLGMDMIESIRDRLRSDRTGTSVLCREDPTVMNQLRKEEVIMQYGTSVSRPFYTKSDPSGPFNGRGIIHIIIPTLGQVDEELGECFGMCLDIAAEHGHNDLAFPAMGCGHAEVQYSTAAFAFFSGVTQWIEKYHSSDDFKKSASTSAVGEKGMDISLLVHAGNADRLAILDAFSKMYRELAANNAEGV